MCWKVEIEWCKCQRVFSTGRSKFVKEADIRVGDSCFFECTGDRLEYNICIAREDDRSFKELLDKYYEGDMFISFMKERHILDRFVIVLACPRSDRKFNNVYIGSLARQFSNDWINGASSILIAHQRQWRVVVKFKHNMCKLGIGWDKYSRDNDLGEGDICVFNLLKYDRKIFRVDVIRS
ncbi:uncharacterized protein LOC141697967 isoform X3 [Apium graveolens]|uniref:uncharacterized protein LOC141697967 isoform X3 n=1 Tax=Apium graveolens TaxID=4045 RepID=UPI003D7ADA54